MTGFRRSDGPSRLSGENSDAGVKRRGRSASEYGDREERSVHGVAEKRKLAIAGTIESDIIPNLLRAHGVECKHQAPKAQTQRAVGEWEVSHFVSALMDGDEEAMLSLVIQTLDRGASIDDVHCELLAPAAAMLGRMWEADSCDFVDVTLGVSRMSHLLHRIATCVDREPAPVGTVHRILLMTAPGEHHTFGLSILERMLSRAGWACTVRIPNRIEDLPAMISKEWYDAVGISVGSRVLIPGVNSAIECLRKTSANKNVQIGIGGFLAQEDSSLAERLGANFAARDGREAIVQLRSTVRQVAKA